MPEKHKLLIMGSGGMLGTDLCKELKEAYDVTCADLVNAGADAAAPFFECDITDKASVGKLIDTVRPRIVLHLAAWTDVDGCELDRERAFRINASGVANVATACADSGAALLYISTDFVFDGRKKEPYRENDATGPLNIYAESKLAGEEAVRKGLERYYIVRTSWLYGKNGKNFVDAIIAKSLAEPELKVVNDQVGSPTYTADLAKAIHVLIDKIFTERIGSRGTGIYHISNTGSVSWYDYAVEILKLAGSTAKVIPISSEQLARPAKRPAMSVMDTSKFTAFTGYEMRNWKDALKEYMMQK